MASIAPTHKAHKQHVYQETRQTLQAVSHDLEIISNARAALLQNSSQTCAPSSLSAEPACLVHLGLEYWAQCSPDQALAIIGRRERALCDKRELMQKAIQGLEAQSGLPFQLTAEPRDKAEDMVDIREDWAPSLAPAPSLHASGTTKRVAHASTIPPPLAVSEEQRTRELAALRRLFDVFEMQESNHLSQGAPEDSSRNSSRAWQQEKTAAFPSSLLLPVSTSPPSSTESGALMPSEFAAATCGNSVPEPDSDTSRSFLSASESSDDSEEEQELDSHRQSREHAALSPSALMKQVAQEYEQKRAHRPAVSRNIRLQLQPTQAQDTDQNGDVTDSLQRALSAIELDEQAEAPAQPRISRFKAERRARQPPSALSS